MERTIEGDARTREERRRALLPLVSALGNVSEACRRLGLDRSEYYRQKRREATEGLRSPLAKPESLERKLIALCLEYPDWGCDRLAYYLTLKGDSVSSPTAQKILMRHGLGRAAQRREFAEIAKEEGLRASIPIP